MGGRPSDREPSDRRRDQVDDADEVQSSAHGSHESVQIYDQNRNLNLDEQEKDLEAIQEPLPSTGQAYGGDNNNASAAAARLADVSGSPDRKQNASPIQSISSSSGTNDSSAGCTSGCSTTTDTEPSTTCSTQRMSQTSSLVLLHNTGEDFGGQQQHRAVGSGEEPLGDRQKLRRESGSQAANTTTHNMNLARPDIFDEDSAGRNQVQSNRRLIAFSRPQHEGFEEEEAQDMKRNDSYIMIRMLDDEAHDDLHFRRPGTAAGQQQEVGLVRQLGRRMSALPQLLGRRKSKASHGDLVGEESRRLSMQETFPYLPDSPPTAAVAGVGGTITTVTRSKRKTAPLPRLVAKNGTVNLFLDNIDRSQYVRDLFTTMIDIKWRYNLMAAAFGFVFSWIFFACIWYVVLYVHHDLVHENDPNWSPCIVNVHSFSAALLFSIETQSTLGFGSRIISVECPGAIVIFCIQLIFGVVVECLIVGMVFAKLSRPAKRSQTIMYSKYATVCVREGQMCLTFRVGDVRSKSHIIGATIRASLVSQKITEEGETIPFYHHQLDVKIDDSKNNLLLIWPLTIVHLIDESSPFYRLNADQLANFKFEIITVLEGTVESTGQSIQVRSSYLPSEVKWGYRFEPIVSTHGCGRYAQTIIDYNKFNRIVEVETPDCCAMEYYSRKSNNPKL